MSAADVLTSGGGTITDASSWIAAGSVTLRRNATSRATTRPLTRYLPVTGQEHFDLRAHIESAGHQVYIIISFKNVFPVLLLITAYFIPTLYMKLWKIIPLRAW
jgi:hypothetical protein